MRKLISFFIMFTSVFTTKSVNDNYDQYVNKSYIVMDSNNNEIIEGKNVNLVRSVASVSKIMSAIVAIEYGDLNSEVIVNKEDLNTYGSSIYLQEGDKISLLDLLYGLMLRSGNDASKVIARLVAGSEKEFVKMMNEKAIAIGMNNSSFNNPSGLDVDEIGNLSTSYDLALLMSYAIKNETFVKISGSKEYKSSKGTWENKNKLLRNYKNTIAGKTGFTYKAKRTLVTAAKEKDTTFVVVTLDCGNDFNFHKFLYEKNFNKYVSYKLLNKGENIIEEYKLYCDKDIYITLEKNELNEYSVLYEINSDIAHIYLVSDGKEEKGKCKIEKYKEYKKKNFLDKLKDFFVFWSQIY